MLQRLATVLICALLTGCAAGNSYDYSSARVAVAPVGSLALGVVDARAYVLVGNRAPSFVGFQQDAFGAPYDVTTESGAPLAMDFVQMLADGYTRQGAKVAAVPLAPGTRPQAAVVALQGAGADRLLLVEMREYKTDAFAEIKVHWNLTARVYDGSGALLVEENSQGVEGTGTLGGVVEAQKAALAVAEAGKRFSELLSRPTIAAALR